MHKLGNEIASTHMCVDCVIEKRKIEKYLWLHWMDFHVPGIPHSQNNSETSWGLTLRSELA